MLKRALLLMFSLPFLLLGLLFFVSAFHPEAAEQGKMGVRLAIGLLLGLGGLVIAIFAVVPYGSRPAGRVDGTVSGQEAPGQLNVKKVKCTGCGADLDPGSAQLSAEGTLSYSCPYCGGTFLLEEAPKW